MIRKQLNFSLVTRFREFADLLVGDDTIHSHLQCSPSAMQISPDMSKAEGEVEGILDAVVVYRDGPFSFVPASHT
tara:strand:+ start:45569 stop:45793 length:225 start_codon:yes stop_codon:yes gene_type:complete